MSDALFNRSACTRMFLTSRSFTGLSVSLLLTSMLIMSNSFAGGAGRVTLDLVAEYNFLEGSGSTVNDVSGVTPALNLTIDNSLNTQWLECGGLSVNSTALISSGVPATKIIEGVKASEEITVEAWITPENTSQSGPARIVTVSDGGSKRNVTLGQNNGVYQTRFRTTYAGDNGTNPYVQTPSDITMSLVEPTHVVYTRNAEGNAITYINGVAAVTKSVDGPVSNWDDTMQFALANELGADRHWLGQLFHVAVYDRALSASEVTQNLNVGVVGTCGQAPTATFSFEQATSDVEYTVDFDANASYDADGSIVSYAWDFGDGSTAIGTNASHVYANAGQYSATLVTTDDMGLTDQMNQEVVVLASGRVVQDQVLFYDFSEGAGATVNDLSGVGTPVNLTIPDASKVSWLSCGGLSIDQPTFISAVASPLKMIDAVQGSNELTIEAWVTPENTTQSGPARIVTYSIDGSNRNFTLGQNKTNYDVRLRTTATNNNGLSPNLSGTGNDVATTLTHVVYTRDTLGQAKLYKNGALVKTVTIASSMDNWNSGYVFGLANENGTDRHWLGDFHLVAVYSRALVQEEVEQNFLQGGGDTCSNVNAAPVLTAIADQTVLENTTATIALSASDADNDVLTFSVTGLPAFAMFNGTDIVVAPNFYAEGSYGPITVSVTDGTDTDSTTFDLTIINNNQPPEITSTPVTLISEGQSYQYDVVATDNDGDALTYSLTVAPTGMSINPLSGVIAWEPNFTSAGAELVIVNVTDGLGNVQQSFTVTINNTNQAPVITSDAVVFATENIAYQYAVEATDADGDELTYQLTTYPSGMTINASGVISWTPTFTQSGGHAVTVSVSDGGLTATQSYVVTVADVNRAPVLTAIENQFVVESNTITVSLNATDADNDTLTFSIVGLPSFASFSGTEIIITPGYDDAGNYGPITVNVSDGLENLSDSFLLNVGNKNRSPIITSDPMTEVAPLQNYQYVVQANDPDGDALGLQVIEGPGGLLVDEATHSLKWGDPVPGIHQIIIAVSDPEGLTAQQVFELNVASENPPVTTEGQEFWAMYNIRADKENEEGKLRALYASSKHSGTIQVESLGLNIDLTYELTPGDVVTIDLTDLVSEDVLEALGTHNYSIHVTSNVDISLYLLNQAKYSSDATLLLPVAALGVDYYAMSYAVDYSWAGKPGWGFANYVGIVATEDNTTVSISPKDVLADSNIYSELRTEPYQIVLNKGDTYQATAVGGAQGYALEVTGTRITSDKPVAVFSGDKAASVAANCCGDHLVEQQPPLTSWGAEYQTLPLARRVGGDTFRILASHDGTIVKINNEFVAILDQGMFYETVLSEPAQIIATKPIGVAQFSNGEHFDSNERDTFDNKADPFMAVVPPVEQFLSNYNITTPADIYSDNFVNIIAPINSKDTIRVDGNPIDSGLWIALPDPGYVGLQLPIGFGQHSLTGSLPFGVYVYGFSEYESYGYIGGMALPERKSVETLELLADNASPKVGESICVNAVLSDESGLPISQNQVFFRRQFMGLSFDFTRLTDTAGKAELCYVGYSVGLEQVKIEVQGHSALLEVDWLANDPVGNQAPKILSLPILETIPGEVYNYQLVSLDLDQDVLQHSVVSGPDGFVIDGETGLVSWNVSTDFTEAHIVIEVSDGVLTDQQSYRLVSAPGSNHYPQFTSAPVLTAMAGRTYDYKFFASDVDNHPVYDGSEMWVAGLSDDTRTYQLIDGPDSMRLSLAQNNNHLIWEVTDEDVGMHPVSLQVTDSHGASTLQDFIIVVEPNLLPEFTSEPGLEASEGHDYFYYYSAIDNNGDSIVYSLESGPEGMILVSANSYYLRWKPTAEQVGNYPVSLNADDKFGGVTTQQFVITVAPNEAPVFISTPNLDVVVGRNYKYAMSATDPEGDYSSFKLESGSSGMVVGGSNFSWNAKAEQVGSHDVIVSANDSHGGITAQAFTLNVGLNQAPQFTSTPIYSVKVTDDKYEYVMQADDANGDAITYNKVSGPFTLGVNNGNVLSWNMHSSYVGTYDVVVRASDAYGAFSEQSFTLVAVGDLLRITYHPGSVTIMDSELYNVTIQAVHPAGLPIQFSLLSSPDGMTIDPTSGVVSWIPTSSQIGSHEVVIKASDSNGEEDTATFAINVEENSNKPPVFTSVPITEATEGELYTYQIEVADPEGAPLTFSWLNSPDRLSISGDGLVSWTPSNEQTGVQTITLRASDGLHTVDQTFDVNVSGIDETLKFESFLTLDTTVVNPGSPVHVSVTTVGAQGSVDIAVTVNASALVMTNGEADFVPSEPGIYDVIAIATDEGTGEVLTQEVSFYAADLGDTEPPIISLIAPQTQDDITVLTDVIASIQDEHLAEYKLYVQLKETTTPLVIAEGRNNVTSSVIGTFDPSMLVNGLYDLILYAVDTNGQEAWDSVSVQVSGDLKVGNFSITMLDADIAAEGVPVRVSRTYDSRRKHENLDFGFGWSIDYQNVRVEESRTPGVLWAENEYKFGLLNAQTRYCIEPLGAPLVTVTLPNGDQEVFEVQATPQCSNNQPLLDVAVTYKAKGDTQSTLTSNEGTLVRLQKQLGILSNLDTATTPIDPSTYTLTTQSGFVYHLDQEFGVKKIETPNGHSLNYTNDGIIHSGGKSILFERDQNGRIDAIIDPMQNRWEYKYDSLGDLISVADPLQNTSTYVYNRSHGLLEIIDPLERRVVKNIYEDGRLVGQENGDGVVKYFNHNISDRTSLVTDLDGRKTLLNYDDKGNVLEEIKVIEDASYETDIVTSFTYDDNSNQETKTIGSAPYTWTSIFDAKNNQLSAKDPENNLVSYENYNARGQEGVVVDELGRETSMYYDAVGNLYLIEMPSLTDPDTSDVSNLSAGSTIINGQVLNTTDLRGTKTHYTYYPNNHVSEGQKWTESNDVIGTTTYTYDANNNVKTEARERTVNSVVVTETVSYDYDERDRLVKTTYPDATYTETQYDPVGNIDKERDRFGVWTDYDYDVYGRLTLTTYVDETTEIRGYSKEGLLKSVIDRVGQETQYEYDDAARLWKTTFHNGSYTETKYTPQGWVQYEWDEKRNLTEYEYFLNGRRKAVIRHIGTDEIRHEYTYYANGELHTETDPLGRVTTYSINEFDQRISTEFHNGTAAGQRYDAMGARTKQIDQNSRTTRYGYDDLGRLETVTPEVTINGQPVPDTSYTYDEVGNKLTQTDAEGRTTTWTYDYYGRVLTRTLPELMSESFVYDDVARTVAHTDFNQKTNTTYIDNQGRVDHIDYHDGTSEAFTYWANGQVHTVTDQHGVTETVYDDRDRLDYEIKPDGTRLDYEYDDVGNREQVKVTRGLITTVTDYTFDELNRLETVTDASGTTTYTYYDNGNLDTVTFPNGVVTNYDYNTVNQLTHLTTRNANGEVLTSYTYGLDDTGRREDITEANGRYTDYIYDNLYRLTDEIVYGVQGGSETYNANYIYDWVGNRTYETVGGVQTAYAYDLNDRLTSQGGTVYVHDDNGNTLTETIDSNVTTYVYDAKNKVTSVDKGGVLTGYAYDSNGIRTSKTEAGITTNFVVDLNRDYAQVLEEVVGDIETAPASVVYTYGHDLLNQDRGGDFRFYLYDGLGSTRGLSNSGGEVTDTYDYEAFGELDEDTKTGTTDNAYLYAGEQLDEETDNYYLRARYLDPSVGRFTQQDTYMGENFDPVTLHKYLYGNASPTMYTDPTGNFSLGSMMSAVNTMGTLVNTASSAYSFFELAAGGGELSSMEIGITLLAAAVPGGTMAKWARKGKNRKIKREDKNKKKAQCFTKGTLVHTKQGLKPIEQVVVGDLVVSKNSSTGEVEYKEVTRVFVNQHKVVGELVLISKDGETTELGVTGEHPFWVKNQGWVDASELRSGQLVVGLNEATYEVSRQWKKVSDNETTYNFEVKDFHTYFVGKEGIWVHNVCKGEELIMLAEVQDSLYAYSSDWTYIGIYQGRNKGKFSKKQTNGLPPGSKRYYMNFFDGNGNPVQVSINFHHGVQRAAGPHISSGDF